MIAIIDYGLGNLKSVKNAFTYLGFESVITANTQEVREASHIVLPGVGAFCDCIHALHDCGMDTEVLSAVASNKPLLGICVGMQMLYEGSEENGVYHGLGVFRGWVRKLPNHEGGKIPHMGWNTIHTRSCPLFDGNEEHDVYFVHSYACQEITEETAATCVYGVPFVAACCKGSVMATQFHPEKSGNAGLRMLKRFAEFSVPVKEGSEC